MKPFSGNEYKNLSVPSTLPIVNRYDDIEFQNLFNGSTNELELKDVIFILNQWADNIDKLMNPLLFEYKNRLHPVPFLWLKCLKIDGVSADLNSEYFQNYKKYLENYTYNF
ncbi:hypothetical protein HF329_00645 [Chitinophaga oryzae]|uniref:Uncharacterized protein n=1 Tax=Chitinophaga oryzae TaxID=2725414 RepID=A0AAE7D5S3_9BACT|nr:hypothetical protein [Chitinophaga oryzae]QJB29892.1 hypothetical protein HF329_00645 [Chitinophaga oryzae]